MDLYLTSDGDITVSPSGDLAVTDTTRRDLIQQAYVRVLTDIGDYVLYPDLGANLSELIGMPQSPETGAYGVQLIEAALNREGVFSGRSYYVTPIPTGTQTIRFDVKILTSRSDFLNISVEQEL